MFLSVWCRLRSVRPDAVHCKMNDRISQQQLQQQPRHRWVSYCDIACSEWRRTMPATDTRNRPISSSTRCRFLSRDLSKTLLLEYPKTNELGNYDSNYLTEIDRPKVVSDSIVPSVKQQTQIIQRNTCTNACSTFTLSCRQRLNY